MAEELLAVELRRDLEQRQRVAVRLRAEAIDDASGHLVTSGGEDSAGGSAVESADLELGQVRFGYRRGEPCAEREDERDALGVEPARDEAQSFRRWPVEPLGVVHHGQHRTRFGGGRQQSEGRAVDPQRLGLSGRTQRHRRAQGVALRARQPIQAIEERAQQVCQTTEGEVRLGLDRSHGEHLASRSGRLLSHPAHKRALADPRLPAQHEHAADAPSGRVEQLAQGVRLDRPARWSHTHVHRVGISLLPAARETSVP